MWLEPTQIWEVQADCFTVSKTHTLGVGFGIDGNKAAHGKDGKGQDQGLSLRFPRFVRQRQDKAFRLPVQHFLDAAIT